MTTTVPLPGWLVGALPLWLDAAAKGLGVLVLAALVLLALGRSLSAAARYGVWLLALVSLLLLPGLSGVMPAWRVLPPWVAPEVQPTEVVPRAAVPVLALASPAPPSGAGVQIAGNPAVVPAPPASADSRLPISPAVLPPAGFSVAGWGWTTWAALVWIVGTVLAVVLLALGLPELWWINRAAEPVTDARLLSELRRARTDLGVTRLVALVSGARGRMPVTWGILRPRILVPRETESWAPERLRLVLLHELAHIVRHDCLTMLLARLVGAAYWFNPMVWVALHRLRVERERACDDRVLVAGARASDYAQELLHIAAELRGPRLVGAAAIPMARATRLESRLSAILDVRRSRGRVAPRSLAAFVAIMLGLVVPIAMLRAAEPIPAPPVPVPPESATRPAVSRSAAAADHVQVALQGILLAVDPGFLDDFGFDEPASPAMALSDLQVNLLVRAARVYDQKSPQGVNKIHFFLSDILQATRGKVAEVQDPLGGMHTIHSEGSVGGGVVEAQELPGKGDDGLPRQLSLHCRSVRIDPPVDKKMGAAATIHMIVELTVEPKAGIVASSTQPARPSSAPLVETTRVEMAMNVPDRSTVMVPLPLDFRRLLRQTVERRADEAGQPPRAQPVSRVLLLLKATRIVRNPNENELFPGLFLGPQGQVSGTRPAH